MLWPKLGGYFLIFFGFICDDIIALRDFYSAFPVDLQFVTQTKRGGDRPEPCHMFGRLKRFRFHAGVIAPGMGLTHGCRRDTLVPSYRVVWSSEPAHA